MTRTIIKTPNRTIERWESIDPVTGQVTGFSFITDRYVPPPGKLIDKSSLKQLPNKPYYRKGRW